MLLCASGSVMQYTERTSTVALGMSWCFLSYGQQLRWSILDARACVFHEVLSNQWFDHTVLVVANGGPAGVAQSPLWSG